MVAHMIVHTFMLNYSSILYRGFGMTWVSLCNTYYWIVFTVSGSKIRTKWSLVED